MEEIIKNLSVRLNLPEETVRSAAGVLLSALKKKASGTQFEKLLATLPGSSSVMFSAPSGAAEDLPGGLLGGFLQQAGQALGGDLGDAAEVLTSLQKAGVPTSKIAPLAKEFFAEAQKTAGPEVVSALVEQVPALKKFLRSDNVQVSEGDQTPA